MATFLALTAAGNSVICGLVKFWKLSLALASACFAGEFWQTTAQETLTVEYTLEGVEGVRHELQVDADEEVLEFEKHSPHQPDFARRINEIKRVDRQ